MILTPKEAKSKWCPHVMTTAGYASAVNRSAWDDSQQISEATRCIAEGCMSWRWADAGCAEGYCGLAGKPPELP